MSESGNTVDRSIKLRPIAYWPITTQRRSDTKVRHACAYLGARGRVVQKGIGEPHVFLLTRASWAEPTGSVYSFEDQNTNPWIKWDSLLSVLVQIFFQSSVASSFLMKILVLSNKFWFKNHFELQAYWSWWILSKFEPCVGRNGGGGHF